MARINLSDIEGYDKLSVEEKLKALEGYDFKVDDSKYVSKAMFDKIASELAAKKKELEAHLSEEEKKALEAKAAAEKLQADYSAMKSELELMKNKAQLLALGYEEKLAEDTAKAMVEGDNAKVFANQQLQFKAMEEKIRADILKSAPAPSGGGVNKTMTKEEFQKLSVEERARIAQNEPETYKAIYGN